MHTLVLRVPGFLDVRIHHNSDWSGDAILATTKKYEEQQEIQIPGAVLEAFKQSHLGDVRDDVVNLCNTIGLQVRSED